MASCGVGSGFGTRAVLNAPLRQAATDSAPNRIRIVNSCATRCFGMSPESQCSASGPFHELSGVHSRETFVSGRIMLRLVVIAALCCWSSLWGQNLPSLKRVSVPVPSNLNQYVKDPNALVVLGKAL